MTEQQKTVERKVVEWTPGKWWIVDETTVNGKSRGYTPIKGPFASKRAAEDDRFWESREMYPTHP